LTPTFPSLHGKGRLKLQTKIMGNKQSSIAVIGAGAIGGATAAFMKQAGWELEIVCKHQETVDRISERGLHITGVKGQHTVRMEAVKDISDLSGPKTFVFLATKATDCLNTARDLLPVLRPDSTVISLQNGICEEALAHILGKERVLGCVVGWGATNKSPGELEVTSEGEFVIGNMDHEPDERLSSVKEMLSAVYPTRISQNIMGELYSKLIINSCINSLGVIGGVTLGKLLANQKARKMFLELMREAMFVAEAMQIKVEPAGGGKLNYYQLLAETGILADLKRYLTIRVIGFKYRRIKSSSLQSLERGRRTEIDFLNGYICDQGKTHGVNTPMNDAVRAMVKEIEDGKREMSLGNLHEFIV
jgi:2-dehydropantoate 2-reductase